MPVASPPAALAVETIEVAEAQPRGQEVDPQRAAIAKAIDWPINERRLAIDVADRQVQPSFGGPVFLGHDSLSSRRLGANPLRPARAP